MPNRLPKPLRILWRLAIGVLVLAAAAAGLRFWLDAKGRAILAKYPPRPPAPARPSMPGSGGPRRIPVRDLPYFAEPNPGDPTSDLFQELRTALTDVLMHAFDANGDPDFVALLSHVKEPVPEGTTQSEAAVVFLQFARKFDPLLDSLKEAVAAGKWDLAALKIKLSQPAPTGWGPLVASSRLLEARVQAEWLSGEHDKAIADLRLMAALARQVDEPEDVVQSVFGNALRHQFFRAAAAGLTPSGLRDADLDVVSAEMAGMDALASFRRGVQKEREDAPRFMRECLEHPETIDAMLSMKHPAHPGSFSSRLDQMLERWAVRHMTDTQIAANAALTDHSYETLENSFDNEKHLYTPPSPQGDRPFFDRLYFTMADIGQEIDLTRAPVLGQSLLDQTRLALALEKHKRATGAYPDSLDAVAAVFPAGLPHDVATGAPYFYEKTAAGGIRLWGTGSDRKNDGGVRFKDAVLKLPEPR